MYRYNWVDSVLKNTLILADKSGLRKRPKQKRKKIDFGKGGVANYMKRFGHGTKDIEKVREEYNKHKKE